MFNSIDQKSHKTNDKQKPTKRSILFLDVDLQAYICQSFSYWNTFPCIIYKLTADMVIIWKKQFSSLYLIDNGNF